VNPQPVFSVFFYIYIMTGLNIKVLFLLAVSFTARTGYLSAQLPVSIPNKGLQAYWPFNGTANDVSGKNRHGNVNQVSLTADRFGNANSAYSFNGFSSFITTNYEGILGSKPRAVSFWAKTNSRKASSLISWGSNHSYPTNGHRFDCGFNYIEYGPNIDISDASITYEANNYPHDGEWHHYVYQFTVPILKNVEIYQDGMLLTHWAHIFYVNAFINTQPLDKVVFGCLFYPNEGSSLVEEKDAEKFEKKWREAFAVLKLVPPSSAQYYHKDKKHAFFFEGQLDDIAIYDRALSKKEIMALYNSPNPKPDILLRAGKWALTLASLALIIWLAMIYVKLRIRKALRKETEKNYLRNNSYEQQNKVLKAQMDPHFIFNSLNTIQQFIVTNDNEKAQLYLYKFSRLMRQMIESNLKDSISLEEEIELCERYLEIETLRFDNIFNYSITAPEGQDPSEIFIPHFLIQPFIENAIWHALLPKKGHKQIDIVFKIVDENTLSCSIDDNGVGRKTSETKTKSTNKKSLAINFIKQRLDLMSKIRNTLYQMSIIDKVSETGVSEGTRVVITMPIM